MWPKRKTPDEVLDALDDFASKLLTINVLGAGRMPLLTSDWPSIQLGKDVFLHSSAPVEWWNEYAAMAAQGYDPGIMMAKTSLVASRGRKRRRYWGRSAPSGGLTSSHSNTVSAMR